MTVLDIAVNHVEDLELEELESILNLEGSSSERKITSLTHSLECYKKVHKNLRFAVTNFLTNNSLDLATREVLLNSILPQTPCMRNPEGKPLTIAEWQAEREYYTMPERKPKTPEIIASMLSYYKEIDKYEGQVYEQRLTK